MTNKQAREKIAALNKQVEARGGKAAAIPKFQTNQEANKTITDLEAQLAKLPPPLPVAASSAPVAAPPADKEKSRTAALDAVTARLEASKLALAAQEAKRAAKEKAQALAAVVPKLEPTPSTGFAKVSAFFDKQAADRTAATAKKAAPPLAPSERRIYNSTGLSAAAQMFADQSAGIVRQKTEEAAMPPLSRAEFDSLSPSEKVTFASSGGQIIAAAR